MFHEFLPLGAVVNLEYYLGILCHLREAIHRKQPNLLEDNLWKLDHDNAPTHMSLLVQEFFAKNKTVMICNHCINQIWLPVTFSSSRE